MFGEREVTKVNWWTRTGHCYHQLQITTAPEADTQLIVKLTLFWSQSSLHKAQGAEIMQVMFPI